MEKEENSCRIEDEPNFSVAKNQKKIKSGATCAFVCKGHLISSDHVG